MKANMKHPKIKKLARLLIELTLVTVLMTAALQLSAFAASFLPLDGETAQVYGAGEIPGAQDGAIVDSSNGQDILKQVVLGALKYVKILTVVLGILFFTIMAYTLVSDGSNEENVTKAKKGMIFTIIAFMMISMSENIAKVFDMSDGTLLGSPQEILNRVRLFDKQAEIIITFTKYIIGTYAVLQAVRSGFKLVTVGGNEEESTKHKKALLYSAGGLMLIYLGDIAINKVFYKVDKSVYSGINGVHPAVDAKAGVEQITGITNFIVTFVGPIGVLMLIVGAVMYATSAGNDEQLQKAKRVLLTAGIGLVIIFGAFAVVSTVISGKLQEIGSIAQ